MKLVPNSERSNAVRKGRIPAPLWWMPIFLAGFSLACGGATLPKVSTATPNPEAGQAAETRQPTDLPTAEATPSTAYLGDAVEKNGYALTAMAVDDPATPGIFYEPEMGKRLFAVEIILGNVSGKRLTVNPLNAALLDADGYVYDMELAGVRDQLALVSLDPGEQVGGWVSFAIPEESTPVAVKYPIAPLRKEFLQAELASPPGGHTPVAATVTPNPPAAKLGDVVEQYGFSLSASRMENPATPGRFYHPQAGTRLGAVEITLGNVSASDPLYVNPIACFLVDADGFVYTVALGGRDGQIGVLELAAGEKAAGWVAFAIPEGSTPLYIKYQTNLFLGNFLSVGVV
jgi:hypothetical protein